MKKVTISAYSDKSGLDRRTIGKYVREAGLEPVERRRGAAYYDEEELLKSIGDVSKKKTESGGKLKDQKTEQEIEKLRIANEKARGVLVRRVDVAEFHGEVLSDFRTIAYAKLADEYPSLMSNDISENRRRGRELADDLMRILGNFNDRLRKI